MYDFHISVTDADSSAPCKLSKLIKGENPTVTTNYVSLLIETQSPLWLIEL